jgi:photosystem II stability/assembly factor-like uncharacterized protein
MRKLVTSTVRSSSSSVSHLLFIALLIAASAGLLLCTANTALAQDNQSYYRLQLKQGGQYLDAAYCSNKVVLNARSDYADGACQLWRLVPVGGGWNRLQLKQGGQYLDAAYCSNEVVLNASSDYAGGACQLWRFVPAGGGWSRLQLKQGGRYLDAAYCSNKVVLNARSDYADGACQLWRLVPSK